MVQKIAVDGAALPQTFDQSQFWYTNVCADALRWGIPTEAKQAADPRCPIYVLLCESSATAELP